jgi:hypothetical protein
MENLHLRRRFSIMNLKCKLHRHFINHKLKTEMLAVKNLLIIDFLQIASPLLLEERYLIVVTRKAIYLYKEFTDFTKVLYATTRLVGK